MRKSSRKQKRGEVEDIPSIVMTELGEADVAVISPSRATKVYLCPLCDHDIEVGKEHVALTPKVKDRLRRHLHTSCLKIYLERGYTVVLHPNERHIEKYYF